MDEYQSLSHSQWGGANIMGCLSRNVAGKRCMPSGGNIEARSSAIWRNARSLDRGGPPDVGSWGHDDIDSAQVRSFSGSRVHQGQGRDSSGTRVWGTETKSPLLEIGDAAQFFGKTCWLNLISESQLFGQSRHRGVVL